MSRMHLLEPQKVSLSSSDLPREGWVLDVGAGGEGIIGQMLGERVIGIDRNKQELEEAPAGALKVVMDVRELKFLDGTFGAATLFFTLMFIGKADHVTALREIHRVLRPGGELHVWDVVIPPYDGGPKEMFVCPLEIHFDGKTVGSGYGRPWPDNHRDVQYYLELAVEAGFDVTTSQVGEHTFYLRLRKGEA